MTAPWLTVIGIGDDGLEGLSEQRRALIAQADVLVGGARHHAMVPGEAIRIAWRFPPDTLVPELRTHAEAGRRVVVLATGDPMSFGIGSTFARLLAPDEMRILPAPSAFSLACARLSWPLHTVTCLTLHGRPEEQMLRALAPGARLLVLSHDGRTPARIAELLCRAGYGASRLQVFAHMNGAEESLQEASAAEWGSRPVADLNTVAVTCTAQPEAAPLPVVPGLPDETFEHDGQLTKREVRAATLAALRPLPGQCLWDLGAGSGAIGIEWLRAVPDGHAVAVERDGERAARARRNAASLGVPGLDVREGSWPDLLDDLPAPNAIFIGGGLSGEADLERCWQRLPRHGRLVANAVTLDSEAVLMHWGAARDAELVRLAVSRAEPVGGRPVWRSLRPVTQMHILKS